VRKKKPGRFGREDKKEEEDGEGRNKKNCANSSQLALAGVRQVQNGC
jgi:hypothetical protein